VRRAEALGADLADLPLEELQAIEPRITADALEVLAIERSIASRNSFGGTAPEQVRAAIALARERFL
jgi:argininosuccinate lyase